MKTEALAKEISIYSLWQNARDMGYSDKEAMNYAKEYINTFGGHFLLKSNNDMLTILETLGYKVIKK